MMRVCLVNTLYPSKIHPETVGGAEKSVMALGRRLAARGHNVSVLKVHSPILPYTEESEEGVLIKSFPTRNNYWLFDRSKHSSVERLSRHIADDWQDSPHALYEALRRSQPDVVHTNTLSAIGFQIWRMVHRLGIPLVHTLRDYNLECARMTRFAKEKRCDRVCSSCRLVTTQRRQLTNLVDAVVGISKSILDHHTSAQMFRSAALKEVIFNPIGALESVPRIERTDFRFGYLGRISPEKGVEMLLDIARKPEFKGSIHIAGEISDEKLAARISQQSNEIVYRGKVNPSKFLAEVDVLIVPSLWDEPFGRTIIEANSVGIPVIASNRGGIPELVSSGENGWLFNSEDPEDLVTVMKTARRILTSRSPGQNVLSFDLEKFSDSHIAKSYEQLYQKLLINSK